MNIIYDFGIKSSSLVIIMIGIILNHDENFQIKYEMFRPHWIVAMIMMFDLLFAGDLIIKEGSVGTKMYFIQVPPKDYI